MINMEKADTYKKDFNINTKIFERGAGIESTKGDNTGGGTWYQISSRNEGPAEGNASHSR